MNRQQGFSLLEILVAFSILAVSLGILLKIFSSGIHTAVIAENYTVATQIAESLMAKTGVETPLTEGEMSGVEDETYHWQVSIGQLSEPMVEEELMARLLVVQVIVKWGEDETNSRFIELNTVRTRQGGDER